MRYPDHDRYHARPDGAVPEAVRKVVALLIRSTGVPLPAGSIPATRARANAHITAQPEPEIRQAVQLSDWLMGRHLAARKDGQLNDTLS